MPCWGLAAPFLPRPSLPCGLRKSGHPLQLEPNLGTALLAVVTAPGSQGHSVPGGNFWASVAVLPGGTWLLESGRGAGAGAGLEDHTSVGGLRWGEQGPCCQKPFPPSPPHPTVPELSEVRGPPLPVAVPSPDS